MAINTRVTKAINVPYKGYQGPSQFQQRIMFNEMRKMDQLNQDIDDQGIPINSTIFDSDKASEIRKTKLDELSKIREGLKHSGNTRETAKKFAEFKKTLADDKDIQLLNARQQGFAAKLKEFGSIKDPQLRADLTRNFIERAKGTELTDEFGNQNLIPGGDAAIAQLPDFDNQINALLRTAKPTNELKPGEITYAKGPNGNVVGYKNTQQGIQQLNPEDLRKEITASLQSDPNNQAFFGAVDQLGDNASVDFLGGIDKYIEARSNLAKVDNVQNKESIKFMDPSATNKDSKATMGNINDYSFLKQENGSNAVFTKTTNLPSDPDKFNEAHSTYKSVLTNTEGTGLFDRINAAYPANNPRVGASPKGTYGNFLTDASGNYKDDIYILDENGERRLMTDDEKNSANIQIEAYNSAHETRNELTEQALQSLGMDNQAVKDGFKLSTEEKIKSLGWTPQQAQEQYDNAIQGERSAMVAGGISTDVSTMDEWVTKKYFWDNDISTRDLDKIESQFKKEYKKKMSSSMGEANYTFSTFEGVKDKIGQASFNDLPNNIKGAFLDIDNRQERYNNSPYELLSNAKGIYTASGEKYDVSEEGLFLRDDIEDGDINDPKEIRGNVKVDSQGFAFNPFTRTYMEKIVVTTLDDNDSEKPITQTLFVEDPEIDKFQAQLRGTGNVEETRKNLNSILTKTNGKLNYSNPDTNLGYSITPTGQANRYNVVLKTARPVNGEDKLSTARFQNIDVRELSKIIHDATFVQNMFESQGGAAVGK